MHIFQMYIENLIDATEKKFFGQEIITAEFWIKMPDIFPT